MAPTIVENNSDRPLKRSLEERRKRRKELGFKTVVDNSHAGTLLYVKVVLSVYTPHRFRQSILTADDAKLEAQEVYSGMPRELVTCSPLDGQWLVRHVQANGRSSFRVDARVGLLPMRLTDMIGVQEEMAHATRMGLVLCEEWENEGWECSHRVTLLRQLKDVPPTWFVDECRSLNLTIGVESKPLRNLP